MRGWWTNGRQLVPMGVKRLLFTLAIGLLSSSLLLLVLVGLVAGGASQGALQDLEDLLVLNLLVRLELREIGCSGRRKTGDAVLGDCCI